MRAHNPVLLNFEEYKAEVTHNERRVQLKGIHSQALLKSMTVGRSLLKKGQSIWAHLFTISVVEEHEDKEVPATIQ